MSILFIILTLILVFAVVIYIVGAKKGATQPVATENKEMPPSVDDDDDSEV